MCPRSAVMSVHVVQELARVQGGSGTAPGRWSCPLMWTRRAGPTPLTGLPWTGPLRMVARSAHLGPSTCHCHLVRFAQSVLSSSPGHTRRTSGQLCKCCGDCVTFSICLHAMARCLCLARLDTEETVALPVGFVAAEAWSGGLHAAAQVVETA